MTSIIKIVVIGDEKTNIQQLFPKEDPKQPSFFHTHGFQPITIIRAIEEKEIRFQSWFLNPVDQFTEQRMTSYNGAMGALIVFDTQEPESFLSIDKWIHEIWEGAGNDIPIVIMGNRNKGVEENMKTTSIVYEYLKELMINEKEGILRMTYVENSLDDNKGYEEALKQLGIEYFYYLDRKHQAK